MTIYVNINAGRDGNGTKESPFRSINDAAKIAKPGDEVIVAPGTYREYVDPVYAGTEEARITYRSEEHLGAVITGAEVVKDWTQVDGNVWVTRVKNGIFGGYNPYTTWVFGDWYFAKRDKHTGCVWLNDEALYEVSDLGACIAGEVYPCSWNPEASKRKWFTEQNTETDETIIYANFGGADPTKENVEITVRRECFMPSKTGVGYITVQGFNINKAATTWAPPAAYQDCMIGPHWSKGWIIEDCEIWGSKCAGIGLGKYLDPDNDHYFTTKHVKSPTQMERDAVCRGQYHGWLKENVGSHIVRRNEIHHCEQGGIIGRMGGVFSVIEDNHIHHINNMMELGGAEIAGIKMHAAIDVIMRRNHIHHSTMGIWCDWEAQGTRISQNLLHDNQRPDFCTWAEGGMGSQDIFVEVGHGPTLIDNNILLSKASLMIATESVAMVHNLVLGAFLNVGGGTGLRYTPYHIRHRTEVAGFMTILHGDDRFYNNIFVQKYPIIVDKETGEKKEKDSLVGTWQFDEYPTYEEWIPNFELDNPKPSMMKLAKWHESEHLPAWAAGNAYLGGAKKWKKETNCFVDEKADVKVELKEKNGKVYLETNVYDIIKDYTNGIIDSDTLGKAFQPEQRFENPDGSLIRFDRDYFGDTRGINTLPGPFVSKDSLKKNVW